MNTETEELLEDMLVASTEPLEPGLKPIDRQVPTDGGPFTLLGIDQDGRLTVFEPQARDTGARCGRSVARLHV